MNDDFIPAPKAVGRTVIRPLIVSNVSTFGAASLREEGGSIAYDDGIALVSMSHPQTISPFRATLAAAWFNIRVAIADAFVWLAEKIGPFQYYGRDK